MPDNDQQMIDIDLSPILDLKDYQIGDVLTLAALFGTKDPRSIEQIVADDGSFEDLVVKSVEKSAHGDRWWNVSFEDGLGTGFEVPEGKEIKVGDTIRVYSVGPVFGGRKRGWALNGELIEYKTDFEMFADRIAMLAGFDRGHRERAAEATAQIEEWLTLLEGPFRARIEKFREKDPTFDMEMGTYETYPCLMAQRIAKYIGVRHGFSLDPRTFSAGRPYEEIREYVNEFHKLPHDEQAKVIHAGQEDKYGISGAQFDFACGTAAHVLAGHEV